jgi:molecular chaperone IbpA
MALAGFSKEDVIVEIEPNLLVVKTTKETKDEDDPLEMYKYKGIAKRDFRRVFYLADLMRVVSCKMDNGMLHIEIEKEIPEEQKPKQITIE